MNNNHHITLFIYPFEDLSPENKLGIFCRSFSEDLITELSRFRQLRVINFPSEININAHSELSETFNPDYFVKGTFHSDGEVVRINVQLYGPDKVYLLWGNRFEGKMVDLLNIKENLLKNIVVVLQQQIDEDLLKKFRQGQKVVFNAYEHCLYGMEELKKGSVEADIKAREYFEKALKIQPDYALAYTGMSLSYFNEWTCQLWERWDLSKSGAYEWARKAIELDDQNHVVAMVLGRIFLYEGSYNTAEYYFRRSLMLNSNDPDTLFTIAVYFVFFGFNKEALELYEKGMQLNPLYRGNHFRLGGCIYFELGEFEKAESFIEHSQVGKARIADTDAYCAAIYYYLGKYDKMQKYWKAYLDTYKRLIARGNEFDELEAIDWLLKLNPHRYKSNIEDFLNHISQGRFKKSSPQITNLKEHNFIENYFIKNSAFWKLSFEGITIQAAEVKGFFDLQKLITQPRQVFHCAELMGSALNDHGEKLIDEKARKQYQKKILELQNDLEEAEQLSNFQKAQRLQEEYDQLIDYLSQSLNLKGRIREAGGTVEKARSAVTWRIRSAIARIEQLHPVMGAHLSNTIKTGTLCSYKPERDINWITS